MFKVTIIIVVIYTNNQCLQQQNIHLQQSKSEVVEFASWLFQKLPKSTEFAPLCAREPHSFRSLAGSDVMAHQQKLLKSFPAVGRPSFLLMQRFVSVPTIVPMQLE